MSEPDNQPRRPQGDCRNSPSQGSGRRSAAGRAARLPRPRADRPRARASRCDGLRRHLHRHRRLHRALHAQDLGRARRRADLHALHAQLRALRNDWARSTTARTSSATRSSGWSRLPERRGMATQVIWSGNDVDGFYTSHLVTGSGRHTQYRPLSARRQAARSSPARIADCMIHKNKIYREWVVADTMAIIKQLGLDPHAFAEKLAKRAFRQGSAARSTSARTAACVGQYPPEAEADLSIAHNDIEAETLRWLHEVFNKRMFGKIKDVYAPTVQYHGPLMKELYGVAAVIAPASGPGRLDPRCGLHAAAHLLDPLRGGRREGRRALDHRRPPSRLRHPAGPRRSHRRARCR